MDALIKDKDIVINSVADTVKLCGIDEILQRVTVAATVPKGSFIYNKELGSELYNIHSDDERSIKKAEMLLKEAVCDIPIDDVRVKKLSVKENNSIAITAEVSCGGNTKEIILNL